MAELLAVGFAAGFFAGVCWMLFLNWLGPIT